MIKVIRLRYLSLWVTFFLICVFFQGCATSPDEYSKKNSQPISIPIPKARKLIAIAGFENKSTYSADKLWDTSAVLLQGKILETGYFRLVEWEKMKTLFDWDILSTCDIVKIPEIRANARKILLCEYFIFGAVTFFDVTTTSETSSISKRKKVSTTIRVDLCLQEADTGEYVAYGKGQAVKAQIFQRGGLGTWNPHSADEALDEAIEEALQNLTISFSKRQEAR
jgi:hypothetical protein